MEREKMIIIIVGFFMGFYGLVLAFITNYHISPIETTILGLMLAMSMILIRGENEQK